MTRSDVAAVDMDEPGSAIHFSQARGTHDERAEAGGIHVIHILHVDDKARWRDSNVLEGGAEEANLLTRGDAAVEVDEGDAFPFAMQYFEGHTD